MPSFAWGGAIDLDPDLVAPKPSFSFKVELVHSNFVKGEIPDFKFLGRYRHFRSDAHQSPNFTHCESS